MYNNNNNKLFSIERKSKILEIVNDLKRVKTAYLANSFSVSEMTIGRDLIDLENDGLIHKVHGGAITTERIDHEVSTTLREKIHGNEKASLARKALKFIQEDDVIFIDASTTSIILARMLGRKNNITIITNSFPITKSSIDQNIKVYCIGGLYDEVSSSFYGPVAEENIEELFANKVFFSAAGISIENGVTDRLMFQSSLKKKMIKNSKKKYLLADISKFEKISFHKIISLCDIDYIITNSKPSVEFEDYFNNCNIQIIY